MIVTESVTADSSPKLFRSDLFIVAAEATDLRRALVAVVDLLLRERAVSGVDYRVGLALSRRLLARFGGWIDVAPHSDRGTRSVLVVSDTAA